MSSNYAHRERPENYDEDDMIDSDGEDAEGLKGETGIPRTSEAGVMDDAYGEGRQDLVLAKALRLRAEGIEKVVVSMLEQPPAVHPHHADDDILATPPTSPKLEARGSELDLHKLPNGVRFRLALGTLLNDLFVRRAPPPPFRHRASMATSPEASTPSIIYRCDDSSLPPEAHQLVLVSCYGSGPSSSSSSATSQRPAPSPSPRVKALYDAGADPSTANSPPDFRCPRHLHTSCEICVAAKPPPPSRIKGLKSPPTANASIPGSGSPLLSRATSSGNSNGTARQRTTSGQATMPTVLGGGISGWQEGFGVGSGLSMPGSGVRGSVLRRKSLIPEIRDSDRGRDSFTNLTELVPRFIRLSALVAAGLGSEMKDEQAARGVNPIASNEEDEEWERDTPYAYTLRPTREWYLLLAGLLTRCVLEGYLTAGWRGSAVLRCVLGVGLGLASSPATGEKDERREETDAFQEFDPDELPSITNAVKMLFPSIRDDEGKPASKTSGEAEYDLEMEARLRKFYDIPPSTPDLSTHMEDVAWLYPAEPVERAATRFCEAIARWRGKPELETYKKNPPHRPSSPSSTNSSAPLVDQDAPDSPSGSSPKKTGHANTNSKYPAPGIERYFTSQGLWPAPVSSGDGKRMRSASDVDGRNGKSRRV